MDNCSTNCAEIIWFPLSFTSPARIRAASWPLRTAFSFAGYHRLPPCGCGHAVGVERSGDLAKADARRTVGNDAGHELGGSVDDDSEPNACGLLRRQRGLGALADTVAFVLRDRGQPSGLLGDPFEVVQVGVDVGDVERPAFIGGGLHQA